MVPPRRRRRTQLMRWLFLASPLLGVAILQAYILVPGRPYMWGTARDSELACVMKGPLTPFGRAMVVGALPRRSDSQSLVRPRRLGVFFLETLTAELHHGCEFELTGELAVRLSRRNIWAIDPWTGRARRVAKIESQNPDTKGEFSSKEFCVAGGTVWFETFDRDWLDALFVQEAGSPKLVFRRNGLFQVLGCTGDKAYVAWDKGGNTVVSVADSTTNEVTKLLARSRDDCILYRGDWGPNRSVYLKKFGHDFWFSLLSGGSDTRLAEVQNRYRAILGNGSVFFLTYDLAHEGGPISRVEEMDLRTRQMVQTYTVKGVVESLAEMSLSSAEAESDRPRQR